MYIETVLTLNLIVSIVILVLAILLYRKSCSRDEMYGSLTGGGHSGDLPTGGHEML